jgi:CBS domain containing-hemolysin-like protein
MAPESSYIVSLLAVGLLVFINGFFVAVEFAIVSSRVTKLHESEFSRKFGTKSALRLIGELDLSLSATQLGITVVSLVLGWYGESIFAEFFLYILHSLGETFASLVSHGLATTLALCLVTFCHVVVGEQAAKSLAIRYPEDTLRYLAPFMLILSQICRPVIFFLNSTSNLFLRMFGFKAATEGERVHTSSELSMLVAASTRYGVLDKDEEQMLQGVFQFSETVAREIMTPRTDVVSIPTSATFDEMYTIVVQSGLSRFPVIGENIDDVKGVLLARDVLRVAPRFLPDKGVIFDITTLLREPYFIPGTKSINDLLTELKRRKVHMALVLDEHGGFDGVVTLEDILEEIVGDIFDESDGAKLDMVYQENGDVLLDGGMLVTDISDAFEIAIPEGDYDTIAGFIFNCLGRLAEEQDKVTLNRHGEASVNGAEFELPRGSHPSAEWARSGQLIETGDDDATDLYNDFIVEKITGNRIETVRFRKRVLDKYQTLSANESPPEQTIEADSGATSGQHFDSIKTA